MMIVYWMSSSYSSQRYLGPQLTAELVSKKDVGVSAYVRTTSFE
jgi:hypothetical protein